MSNLLIGGLVLGVLGSIVACLLGLARSRQPPDEISVVERINSLLPQTQCAQCGHPGCRPYAEAIAAGEPINRCPPGGQQTIAELAELLGREVLPLDESFGQEQPPTRAVIREPECIGCTLCIQACPVDAIIGSQGHMHVVIEDLCTGCDLCLPPCPVDCIDMFPVNIPPQITAAIPPLKPASTSAPCIRCGDCEIVCPRDLQPQELFWQRSSLEAMESLNLDACVECRLCDRSCPSHIPLTQYFVEAKGRAAQAQLKLTAAKEAEARYEARKLRLEKETAKVKPRPGRSHKQDLLARLKSS